MNKNDKPEGEKVGWHLLDTTYPFVTKWIKLRQDRVHLDRAGREIDFTYYDGSGAVCVVPVTADGQLVLIKQYRYTVDEWCLEVPAGGLHDAGEASIEDVVRKELCEEIGASCARLTYVNNIYEALGQSSQRFHIYLAEGVAFTEQPEHEDTENIELCPVPASEAVRLARTGQIKDGVSALAILLCEDLLRELGCI